MHKHVISGIYRIVNTKNGKCYIGSAVYIQQRKSKHFSQLRKKKHHSIVLQRAYNKYGKECLKFEILVTCPKEYLVKLEQWFIDNIKPEYNCTPKAGSMLGFKHSPEVVAEIKRRNKGQVSPTKGRKYSEEHKKVLSEAHSHERKPVYSFTLDGKLVKRYNSRKEAVLEGFDYANISRVIQGKYKHHKGLIWKNTL